MRSQITPSLPQNQSSKIYDELVAGIAKISSPHKFVGLVMSRYAKLPDKPDRSIHGRVFEFAIGEVLLQAGARPLYYQAEIHHVPLAAFDWFLYHPKTPVSVSCKTKARDRWKQAAYEGLALKRIYSQAVNYLVTIEKLAATEDKILQAPQTIDRFVIATKPEFDDVIDEIARIKFEKAEPISPIVTTGEPLGL